MSQDYKVIRDIVRCKVCGAQYMLLGWMQWRKDGFCSQKCGNDTMGKDTYK